jgi:hypothetical protein
LTRCGWDSRLRFPDRSRRSALRRGTGSIWRSSSSAASSAEFPSRCSHDEAGNPDTARQHVDRYLKRDRIHFYTGPIGSNVALAVGPTLFAAEVFYLSNNAGPSQLAGSQCNAFFFGTAWQNDLYHEAAGKFTAERGFGKVAVSAELSCRTRCHQRLQARLWQAGRLRDLHQARATRLRRRTREAAR